MASSIRPALTIIYHTAWIYSLKTPRKPGSRGTAGGHILPPSPLRLHAATLTTESLPHQPRLSPISVAFCLLPFISSRIAWPSLCVICLLFFLFIFLLHCQMKGMETWQESSGWTPSESSAHLSSSDSIFSSYFNHLNVKSNGLSVCSHQSLFSLCVSHIHTTENLVEGRTCVLPRCQRLHVCLIFYFGLQRGIDAFMTESAGKSHAHLNKHTPARFPSVRCLSEEEDWRMKNCC